MVMRWIALVRGTDRREIPAVHVSRHPCPENGAGCRNGDYTSGCCIAGIRIISGGLPDLTFPALSSGRNTTRHISGTRATFYKLSYRGKSGSRSASTCNKLAHRRTVRHRRDRYILRRTSGAGPQETRTGARKTGHASPATVPSATVSLFWWGRVLGAHDGARRWVTFVCR